MSSYDRKHRASRSHTVTPIIDKRFSNTLLWLEFEFSTIGRRSSWETFTGQRGIGHGCNSVWEHGGSNGMTIAGKGGSLSSPSGAISTTTRPHIWRNAVTGKRNHGIICDCSRSCNRSRWQPTPLATAIRIRLFRSFTRGDSYHLSASCSTDGHRGDALHREISPSAFLADGSRLACLSNGYYQNTEWLYRPVCFLLVAALRLAVSAIRSETDARSIVGEKRREDGKYKRSDREKHTTRGRQEWRINLRNWCRELRAVTVRSSDLQGYQHWLRDINSQCDRHVCIRAQLRRSCESAAER